MQRNLRVGSRVPCPAAGVKCCRGCKSFVQCLFSTGSFWWCFPAGSHVLTVWEQDGQRVCSLQGRCCSASAVQGIPTGTFPLSWCQPLVCPENTRTSGVLWEGIRQRLWFTFLWLYQLQSCCRGRGCPVTGAGQDERWPGVQAPVLFLL